MTAALVRKWHEPVAVARIAPARSLVRGSGSRSWLRTSPRGWQHRRRARGTVAGRRPRCSGPRRPHTAQTPGSTRGLASTRSRTSPRWCWSDRCESSPAPLRARRTRQMEEGGQRDDDQRRLTGNRLTGWAYMSRNDVSTSSWPSDRGTEFLGSAIRSQRSRLAAAHEWAIGRGQ